MDARCASTSSAWGRLSLTAGPLQSSPTRAAGKKKPRATKLGTPSTHGQSLCLEAVGLGTQQSPADETKHANPNDAVARRPS